MVMVKVYNYFLP